MAHDDFQALNFLLGGGEMGDHIRAKDWGATPLGAPGAWPSGLRTVIRLMLTTNHPIFVFWGPDLICFYNDAYSASIGSDRHPSALGRPGRKVWDEVWDLIGPQIDIVMSGQGATWNVDHLVPITRNGVREDVYWTYSYSPIDEPTAPNGVGGVLVICTETTERVLAEKKLQEELQAREVLLKEVNHRIKNSLQIVSTLLRIEARAARSDDTRASLRRASARVDAIASVHELIYRTDSILTVEMGTYIFELCEAISASLGKRRGVRLDCDSEDITLPTDTAITLALLINELVTNAFKHGFPDGREGTIKVRVSRRGDIIRLRVADDGMGKPDDARAGLGTRIIEGLVRQLGASMEDDTGSGYRVDVHVPVRN